MCGLTTCEYRDTYVYSPEHMHSFILFPVNTFMAQAANQFKIHDHVVMVNLPGFSFRRQRAAVSANGLLILRGEE